MLCIWSAAPLIGAFVEGCNPGRGDRRRFYLLDVTRDVEEPSLDKKGVLAVREFDLSPRFRTKDFVYRTDKFSYESDYYHSFLTWPEILICEQTRQWLSGAGIFTTVLKPGDELKPTHVLKGSVTALYGDFTSKSSPKAVMAIRFFLLEAGPDKSRILLDKVYDVSLAVKLKSPKSRVQAQDLVEAYNECLQQVLFEFEKDIKNALSGT